MENKSEVALTQYFPYLIFVFLFLNEGGKTGFIQSGASN